MYALFSTDYMRIKASQIIIILVATAFFMEFLDATAITTALPQMAASFHTDSGSMSLGITAYMMALAVFIPISGWIADRFGMRSVFASAVIGFILSSILCSFSQNLAQFTGARILQGIAGAMMVPVGRLAVLRTCKKSELVSAIAYITWPGLVAPIIGPPLGGFLTTYLTWHWIFYLNIPFGLLVVFFTLKYMPNESSNEKRPLDIPGFLLSGGALAGIMYSLELCGSGKNEYALAILLLFVSLLMLKLNSSHALRSSHPLIDYSVLRIPTYSVTIFYGALSMMVIGAAPFLLPLMFQEGLGMNPFESGLLFLALMVGNLVIKPATIWITRHWGFKYVLIVNCTLLSVSTAVCALFTAETSHLIILFNLFLMGCFRSMQFSSLNTLAFADVPAPQMSSANTLFSTIQQVSAGMGIALGALVLRISTLFNQTSAGISLNNYRETLFVIGIFGFVSLIGFIKMNAGDGHAVSGFTGRGK